MEYVDYALRAVVYFAPYFLAAGAGAYLEYKYGSAISSRVAALEASVSAKGKEVKAEAEAVKAKL